MKYHLDSVSVLLFHRANRAVSRACAASLFNYRPSRHGLSFRFVGWFFLFRVPFFPCRFKDLISFSGFNFLSRRSCCMSGDFTHTCVYLCACVCSCVCSCCILSSTRHHHASTPYFGAIIIASLIQLFLRFLISHRDFGFTTPCTPTIKRGILVHYGLTIFIHPT